MDQERNLSLMESCFESARITDAVSASTVDKYRDSIRKFFSIIDKDAEELEIRDFNKFILQMKDNGANNSRIANVISAVKWMIKKAKEDELANIPVDLDKIKKPKIERKEVSYMNEEEIKCFLDVIKKDLESSPMIRKFRMMALVVLLLQTGSRIGEALSIEIEKIDRSSMEIPIIGKGRKPRSLIILPETLYWIDEYLKVRKSDNKFLFTTLNGQAEWQQTNVGRSFRRYRKMAGITKPVVLHTLRHTAATQWTLKGAPLNLVQYLLGHSRLETTMRYYIGAVEKNLAKQMVGDEQFRFIPKDSLSAINSQNSETPCAPSSPSPYPLPDNTCR